MTIKQHGGIFGRNPTFNNITVGGTLTVDQIVEKTGAAGITLDGVTLKDGNVVLADGKGIDFSATAGTGTSELFDDYEEGTFTPSIAGNTTAGTHTYTTRVGRYTKIGDMVYVQISIVINAMGTGGNAGAGYTTITGLPFTLGGSDQISFSVGWLALVTFTHTLSVYGGGGNSVLTLRELESNAYGATVPIGSVADGAYISISGCYKI